MIHVVYPHLPPSSNKIYFRGTILTKHAREYAEEFSRYFATTHGHQVLDVNPDLLYALHLHFFFPTLINEGWVQRDKDGKRKAKSPYKKIDLSNRIKLLEDCIRDAIGVDDSHTFAASQEKHHDPINPRVEIFIHPVDPDTFGIPKEFQDASDKP